MRRPPVSKYPSIAIHPEPIPMIAQELGLFDAIRNSPRGTVVTIQLQIRVERRELGNRMKSAAVIAMKIAILTNLMRTTDAEILGPTKALIAA